MTDATNGDKRVTEYTPAERRDNARRGADRRVASSVSSPWQGTERRTGERGFGDRREFERRVELPEGLHHLDLPQQQLEFHHFIASWFFVDGLGRRILVDPGPANTIPMLVRHLSEITNGVDLVLLTHIHLDHAGGVAQLCEIYKGAKVLAAPAARKHLLNPAKLWEASLRTLDKVAEIYGSPLPLSGGSLLDHDEIEGITVMETPGHAVHHISFIIPFRGEKLFFVGEAAGLYLPAGCTPTLPYLRPTTPPKFDGAAARASLRKIEQTLQGDELLCYAHWGAARRPHNMIAMAKGQLDEWLSVIAKMQESTPEEITDYLLEHDPLLSGTKRLSSDLQERERLFIKNSVKGFLGYLKNPKE